MYLPATRRAAALPVRRTIGHLGAACAVLALGLAAGCGDDPATATAPTTTEPVAPERSDPTDTATEPGDQTATTGTAAGLRPDINQTPIPYGAKRQRDMAAYAKRHYGVTTSTLKKPKTIVEHIAVAGSAESVRNTFTPNRKDPELGELPGLCTHFVIGSNGEIDQLVPLERMCRHTVGLNHVSIGIEHVGFQDGDLLGNERQLKASLRLTRWLRCRYDLDVDDVIGHSESLDSPHHAERVESLKTQTHGDMAASSMRRYREQLGEKGCRA
ncbi:MAG: N-acetylmuramoyl-L-alanine amidase [Solirubrobacterales bacterium]